MFDIYNGEALRVLESLPAESVDAIITDPPYSSGGFTRGDRNQETAAKYVSSQVVNKFTSFTGDNRDSRSFAFWCSLWIAESLRVLKPGGYFLQFTDWRQLPIVTDAAQAGGVVWRGLLSWDKGRGARAPHKGYFRHQCEYVVWGTKGALDPAVHAGPYDGSYTIPVKQSDKFHQTGKPTELMRQLAMIVPPGGTILDPFMGSGTTGVGALMEGRNFVGIELHPEIFSVAENRLQETADKVQPRQALQTAAEETPQPEELVA